MDLKEDKPEFVCEFINQVQFIIVFLRWYCSRNSSCSSHRNQRNDTSIWIPNKNGVSKEKHALNIIMKERAPKTST